MDYNKATPLLHCLSQSLSYFEAGCRDENDLMFIVKLTTALESLILGKTNVGSEVGNVSAEFELRSDNLSREKMK